MSAPITLSDTVVFSQPFTVLSDVIVNIPPSAPIILSDTITNIPPSAPSILSDTAVNIPPSAPNVLSDTVLNLPPTAPSVLSDTAINIPPSAPITLSDTVINIPSPAPIVLSDLTVNIPPAPYIPPPTPICLELQDILSQPEYSWDKAIASLLCGLESVLTELGNEISRSAKTISLVFIGIGFGYALMKIGEKIIMLVLKGLRKSYEKKR